MNDEGLTAHERSRMRDLVTTGTKRMRVTRARRMQFGAGAAAVALVAVVVAGVVLGTTRGSDQIATPVETSTVTPSPSPTPPSTPSPTLAPIAEPADAVLPFGGSCANMLSLEQASGWLGADVRPVAAPWISPEVEMAGGMTCTWAVPDAYMWGYVEVTAYPASLFDALGGAPVDPGQCADARCRAAAVDDEMWLAVTWVGDADDFSGLSLREIRPAELDALFRLLSDQAVAFAPPRPAERAAGWWPAAGCDVLQGATEEAVESGSATASDYLVNPGRAYELAGLGDESCVATDDSGATVWVGIAPGGGPFFDSIATAAMVERVEVPGSDGAVIVPDNYLWEASGMVLVVRSGDNLVTLAYSHGEMRDGAPQRYATDALTALNATLG